MGHSMGGQIATERALFLDLRDFDRILALEGGRLRAIEQVHGTQRVRPRLLHLGGDGGDILSNEVLSQIAQHAAYGGVVPEVAARLHVETLPLLIDELGVTGEDLDGIAVTRGPGLITSLRVGTDFARALQHGLGMAGSDATTLAPVAQFGATEVLRRLYPHTGRAQVIGITGNPGSGKSTLANLLLRFWDANEGQVLVGGVDTTQSQLAHAVRLLAAKPDQWRLLAERPELALHSASDPDLQLDVASAS